MSENKEQEISLISKVNFINDIPEGGARYDLFNIAVVYKTGQKFDMELIETHSLDLITYEFEADA